MPMNESLLKVELSPAAGQMFGYFTEGMPIAECIGHVVGIQIDNHNGTRRRVYGTVSGVEDMLTNIDNRKGVHEQVMTTTIYFVEAPATLIVWSETAVAVGEVAVSDSED